MLNDLLFHPLTPIEAAWTPTVAVTVNGHPLEVPVASSVAASLLASGVNRFRNSPVSGEGRGPYCMMGVCFECLLEIDGLPNRQGCLEPLRAGMCIKTQDGLRDLTSEGSGSARAGSPHVEGNHAI